MATETTTPPTVESKFARYRSVRKAPAPEPPLPIPTQPDAAATGGVQRSMSRYHKQRRPTVSAGTAPPVPSVPQLPAQPPLPERSQVRPVTRAREVPSNVQSPEIPSVRPRTRHNTISKPNPGRVSSDGTPNLSGSQTSGVRTALGQPSDAARAEARQLMAAEQERQQRIQAKLRAEKAEKRQKLKEQEEAAARARRKEEEEKAKAAKVAEEQQRAERAMLERKATAPRYQRPGTSRKVSGNDPPAMPSKSPERPQTGYPRPDLNRKVSANAHPSAPADGSERPKTGYPRPDLHRNQSATGQPTAPAPSQVPVETRQTSPSKGKKDKSAAKSDPEDSGKEILPAPAPAPAVKAPTPKDRLGFLRRKKGDEAPTNIMGNSGPMIAKSNGPEPATIKPGGGGVVLGIDAPKSAVNAGERRVMVECNKQKILLPITPTTTPVELVRSAANCLTEQINPKTGILLEAFSKVGITRPLRKYEHVRDVMNSWDDDQQNSLFLDDISSLGPDPGLEVANVPSEKPDEKSWWLYYSQKPGKWKKSWFTLRKDGQLVHNKSDTSAAKDASNVCHMSDFDIYWPNAKAASKKIKPPKKFCYAIKSQQKSSMFETTTDFVHFFATSHEAVAKDFYSAVQGWRSWYLVHVMGEGQKATATTATSAFPSLTLDLGGNFGSMTSKGHQRSQSEDSHYQLGSFMPLLDLEQFQKDLSYEAPPSVSHTGSRPRTATTSNAASSHQRMMSMKHRGAPPVSFPHRFVEPDGPTTRDRNVSVGQSVKSQKSVENTFAPSGLLGQEYEQRQNQLAERDFANAYKASGPFTSGPSLLNDLDRLARPRTSTDAARPIQRSGSVRSTTGRGSSDIRRSTSQLRGAEREKVKPLIDLTPRYIEPPQHSRKGKGYHPDNVGPGGLIDNATSPEVAIPIPPVNDWRAPRGRSETVSRPHTSGADSVHHSHSHQRTKSLKGGPRIAGIANNHDNIPPDLAEAFTGAGLLGLVPATAAQGARDVGRGVTSGARGDGRPLLDLNEGSRFAPGSMLERVEKLLPSGPVIDREKREERDVGTGEGL